MDNSKGSPKGKKTKLPVRSEIDKRKLAMAATDGVDPSMIGQSPPRENLGAGKPGGDSL